METKAKLDSGVITPYHRCCDIGTDTVNPEAFKYIGSGVIYSVGGVLQRSRDRHKFFVRKDSYVAKGKKFNRFTALTGSYKEDGN
jgi:hypothetical protein